MRIKYWEGVKTFIISKPDDVSVWPAWVSSMDKLVGNNIALSTPDLLIVWNQDLCEFDHVITIEGITIRFAWLKVAL